jgi:hypothetical protein
MVTWGPNTVNTFSSGNAGSANPAFTAPSTPSTPSFFGAPTAASPATPAFSFSSQPNPVNSPATSFFTPVSAPAPTAANAFSQVLGAPQQAALQAHINAAMHQEQSRLSTQLMQLQAAYNPTHITAAIKSPCRFQHIFYDPITQTQRLEKLSVPQYPPKPPQISDEEWYHALTHNPDPEEYIPVVVTSAEGLHSRLVAQQSKMKLHEEYVNQLDQTLEHREQIHEAIAMQLEHYQRKNRSIQGKLNSIMQKFEMCRGKNVPLQNSERQALVKLMELVQAVETCGKMLEGAQRDANNYQRQWEVMKLQRDSTMGSGSGEGTLDPGFKEEVMKLLNASKTGIDSLKTAVKKSERDMGIIKNDGRKAVGMMG